MIESRQTAPKRAVDLIVVHCSATPNGRRVLIDEMDRWHVQRGFRRSPEFRDRHNPDLSALGYHFVIYVQGQALTGRALDEYGAHVVGSNKRSIGICLVGTDRYTPNQWSALAANVRALAGKYGKTLAPYDPRSLALKEEAGRLYICGHRDLSPDQDSDGLVEPWEWLKTCPGFDVRAWLARGMQPDPANVLQTEGAAA